MGRPRADLHRSEGIRPAQGGRGRAREVHIFRWVPSTSGLWRPADGMARGPHHVDDASLLHVHGKLWACHHPADGDHQGALLPAHDQEHDFHAGHAGAAAPDQRHPVEVQERRSADAAGDDGALSRAQGQPAGRVPAHGRPDPNLLRPLRLALRVGGIAEPAVHLLRPPLRGRSVDLRPGRPRSDLCAAAAHGGLDVIRVSGARAVPVVSTLVRLSTPGGLEASQPRVLHRAVLMDPLTHAELDVALVARMPGPASYTGEDVVELSCHGNPVLLGEVVRLLVASGARLAEPGEFTRRAYLNGRLDLVQVEAVAELIVARTERTVRLAARQLQGALSGEVTTVRDRLIDLVAGLEVALDFAEEEIGMSRCEALKGARDLMASLARLVSDARDGRAGQDGLSVMLAGAPNVGKSSMLDALFCTERAIVSSTPGTPPDLVDGAAVMRGVPVRVIDGAGLGTPRDAIDAEGMRRARQALAESDLVLVVVDMSRAISPAGDEILALSARSLRLVVANKSDLPSPWDQGVASGCAC